METGNVGLEWMGGPGGEVDRKRLLETFDGMTKELEDRSAELSDAQNRLEKNLEILNSWLTKAANEEKPETSETLQEAVMSVFERLMSLSDEMESVSGEIDNINDQYLAVNRLPPPVNE